MIQSNKSIILLVMLFLSLLAFRCTLREDETREIEPGKDIIPGKIISLNPAITEELYSLDAGSRLAADTIYCRRPDAAKMKKKIGDIMNFDMEMILDIKPDLILSSPMANKSRINKLKQLKIKVIEFPTPLNFKGICDNFYKLGESIGESVKAKEIIESAGSEVENIIKMTGAFPKKKVFMQIGAKPLVAANKDYFINDYIRSAGGINICEDSGSNMITREAVLAADPDIIMITDMGIVSEEEKISWEKYKSISAVKNRKIFTVDSDIFCNPTVHTFIEALKKTASILHPEIDADAIHVKRLR